MENVEADGAGQFYFAFPRLIAWLGGAGATRTEGNCIEAYVAGVAVFSIPLLLLARVSGAQSPLALALLLFATWIVWLLVLYANSLVVRALRPIGLFRGLSPARAQNIVIGIETTIVALVLIDRGGWSGVVGWVAAILIGMDVCAAVLLALLRETARS